MTNTAAIYVIPYKLAAPAYILYAMRRLRVLVDKLIVVTSQEQLNDATTLFAELNPDLIMAFRDGPITPAAGYKVGLAEVWDSATSVILTGSHVASPLGPMDRQVFSFTDDGAHFFSPYWHSAKLDPMMKGATQLDLLPSLDFAIVSEPVLRSEAFRSFWRSFIPSPVFYKELVNTSAKLAEMLAASGFKTVYPSGTETFETYAPSLFEVHKVVEAGLPCIPMSVFTLDPLIHDLNSIDLRIALDKLRVLNPKLYACIIQYVTRNTTMREFNTIADQYEVVPERAENPGKTEWNFGRIAVFIHAYYAEMMPEFWQLVQRIPCDFDLFITTSTAENKVQIETYLSEHGFPQDRTNVVIVAQNRGRDMSSLFISFRDVILSDKYKVALRLHSKRTPQVSRQVGESFKKHLFDNLIKSKGHVSNILDRLEAEPDIGMIIPPVIHIGFGTLGHSWFNNRKNFADIAKEMGIKLPFDHHTPVAPYGTMYWFRTDALRRMFEWEWKWEDYNAEPNHIDGGLAHVQERLIGYCVQDRGYRIWSVMTPELAARNYAKLEYKLQLLAAHLMSGNIWYQRDQLTSSGLNIRRSVFRFMERRYGGLISRFPGAHRFLQPAARLVSRVLRAKI